MSGLIIDQNSLNLVQDWVKQKAPLGLGPLSAGNFRPAGLGRARDSGDDSHPARTQEEAAHRLCAQLKRARCAVSHAGSLAPSPSFLGHHSPHPAGSAVFDRPALSVHPAGLDADAVALGDRALASSASPFRSAASRRRCRLPSSSPKTAASAAITALTSAPCARPSSKPAISRKHAAPRRSRSRRPRTCSSGPGTVLCARRSKSRWRYGSTWCCRSGASWKSISTSPSGVPTAQFGAEAGARWAFGKPARDLTAREAAELAAILPNPVRRSARAPSALVRRLAGLYERRAAAHPALDACIRSPERPSVTQGVAL